MRKALYIVITCFILAVLIPVTANAAKNGLFSYELKGNGTAVITEFDWNAWAKRSERGEIVVPQFIDGYTVTEIADYGFSSREYGFGFYDDNYDYLIKENYSGYHAMLGPYRGYTRVVLPNTLTAIGEKAFYCTPVAGCTIPSSVREIGDGAFAGTVIEQFVVESGNMYFATIDGALYNKREKKLLAVPRKRQNRSMFSIDGIYIIEEIGNENSRYHQNIDVVDARRVEESKTNAVISIDLFKTSIHIPEGIETIGSYAFCGLYIDDITIPRTVKRIDDWAFAFTTFNTDYILIDVETIGKFGFYNSIFYNGFGLGQITQIGDCAFEAVDSFVDSSGKEKRNTQIDMSIQLPECLSEIGVYAFFGCKDYEFDLTKSKLVSIPTGAFYGVEWKDNRIIIPPTVESINAGALFRYQKVNSIEFSTESCLKTIGSYERDAVTHKNFREYGDLDYDSMNRVFPRFDGDLKLPETLEIIGDNALEYAENCTVIVPSSVKMIGSNAFGNKNSILIKAEQGTYAEFYALENGYTLYKEDDTSWLTE